jgi:antimicrobial peptide system SdpA family protein
LIVRKNLDEADDTTKAECERGFLFTAAILFTGLLVTLASQLPGLAPGWLTGQRPAYRALWPQGWSFFADAAAEDVLVVYRAGSDGASFPVVTRTLMSAANDWGLSRVAYVQILETRQIAEQVPGDRWTACHDSSADACLRNTLGAPAHEATNGSARPTICGPVILAVERPEPWSADRQAGQNPRSVARTASVRVRCAAQPAR